MITTHERWHSQEHLTIILRKFLGGQWAIMLGTVCGVLSFIYCYAECPDAERPNAERPNAGRHYAGRHNAERLYAERRYAERHYAERHYAECHYAERHCAGRHNVERHYAERHYNECRGIDKTPLSNNDRKNFCEYQKILWLLLEKTLIYK